MSGGRQCQSFLNSTLEGVRGQIRDPAALPWRKRSPLPVLKRMPRSGSFILGIKSKSQGLKPFTVLQCSHQHCVQPVASDVEVVGYL